MTDDVLFCLKSANSVDCILLIFCEPDNSTEVGSYIELTSYLRACKVCRPNTSFPVSAHFARGTFMNPICG